MATTKVYTDKITDRNVGWTADEQRAMWKPRTEAGFKKFRRPPKDEYFQLFSKDADALSKLPPVKVEDGYVVKGRRISELATVPAARERRVALRVTNEGLANLNGWASKSHHDPENRRPYGRNRRIMSIFLE